MIASQAKYYAQRLVEKYHIDCSGLTILTEAASGAYIYNPLIPILANANKVITFCRPSRYGSVEDIRTSMFEAYGSLGLGKKFEFITELEASILEQSDLITNSGHLRPIGANFIKSLRDTAVISLMWEPWEMRKGEIDLVAARKKGILIMGTNEHDPPCDMRPYSFLTALRLLMDLQVSIANDNLLIMGDQPTLALAIADGLRKQGYASKSMTLEMAENQTLLEELLDWASVILIAEHADKRLLLGKEGIIRSEQVIAGKVASVGLISGLIETEDLLKANLAVLPKKAVPQGYMAYSPSELGCFPVMNLFSAGIKVGQAMVRARLGGHGLKESAEIALESSPALDLEGEWSWI